MQLHCFHKTTTPTCLSHLADPLVPLTVQAFDGGYTAWPICFSAFRTWSASLALPDYPSHMPSADSRPKAGLPGSSRLLSARNRRIYMKRLYSITVGLSDDPCRTSQSDCVAPSSPCLMPQIRHLQPFQVSGYLYVSPRIRLRLPQGRLTDATFAFDYPCRYLTGAGLAP